MMRPRHLLAAATLLVLGACSALQPDPPIERDAAHRLDRGLAALDAGRYQEAFADLAWVYTHCPGHARGAEALVGLTALELDPRNRAGRPAIATDLLGRIIREPESPDFVRPLAESAYLMALALGAPEAPGRVATQPAPDMPQVPLGAQPAPEPPPAAARQPADTARAAPAAAAEADSAAPARTAGAVAVAEVRAPAALQPATDTGPVHGCGARIDPRGWVAPQLPLPAGPSLVALLAQAERTRESAAGEAATLRQELAATQQKLRETEAELERIRKTLKP